MTRVNVEGPRPDALIGHVLRGKWRLDHLLGAGGMAAVYAGTHRNGMRGAVKILRRELSENEEARSRFLREGYVANRVDHPGIVRVLDDDVTEDGAVFLVMELLEGETVEARRARAAGGVLGVAEVLAIADELLDVLAVAHERGIVHRDLKPDNLFLTRQGQLKVLDFGIARLNELSGPTNASTRAGTLMGTPQYMPPEQAKGQWDRVDARADLWAVGSTMFHLLSGRYVHQAETLPLLLLAAMTQPAPPVGSVLPAAPAAVAGVIDVALAFEPERRWPSARAMQRALRQARGGAGLDPGPGARPELARAPALSEPACAPALSEPACAPALSEPACAPMLSEPARAPMLSDAARAPVPARGPGSGPRGTEFTSAGTASGGTVSPIVPARPASAPRPAPRAAATVALVAGAGVLVVAALGAVVWWQSAGAAADAPDLSGASAAQAEPGPPVDRATAAAADPAAPSGAGAPEAPAAPAAPDIAPSAPAPAITPATAPASPASASASTARPAAGARPPAPAATAVRVPASTAKAPAATAKAPAATAKAPAATAKAPAATAVKAPPAPTPAADPYSRRY
ncbi:protein kinase [Sorangium cellulosum]|uniref:Protein kinase n=1 Tax=Sorangium cellulosum TaxID=56 RepID=A0A4P2Q657_SORCE|nr:serine/threonine protein kinase [Sorangium cellulosum]AUX24596.1 protein kinase [Sorangium cellulosum]